MSNKKIWKSAALLMASVMAFSACGQEKVESQNGEAASSNKPSSSQSEEVSKEETSYFNATGYPIVNEEITLKVLTYKNPSSTMDYEDMPGWKYLSELTGIKFDIEAYTAEDLATKLPLIMSDPSSMPDLFIQCGISGADMLSYGTQGHFLELEELIEKYGENIKKSWETEPMNKSYATSTNGAIYGLPSYNYTGLPSGIWTFLVNDRWMKNCGITEYPTTVDELKEMFIKFRDMDANGNGITDDEIPMNANMGSMLQVLASAFDIPLDWPWVGAQYAAFYGTTEAVPVFMTDNYRAMIEYIHELYEEELINTDLFSVSAEEDKARRVSDLYGVHPVTLRGDFLLEEKFDPDEYSAIPLVGSEYRKDTTSYAFATPAYQTGMGAISAYTEYPEACIRVLDYLMSADGTALMHGVPHDGSYDLKAAGVSQEVIDIYANAMATTGMTSAECFPDIIGSQGSMWKYQFVDYQIDGEYANNIAKTYNDLWKSYIGKEFYNPTYTITFTEEEQKLVSMYQTDIDGYVQETIAKWVIGEEELNDQTWDVYLKTLEKMNVDKLTEAYVGSHNRFFAVD